MPDIIELNPADSLAAGAIGEVGHRVFLIQARANQQQLTVVVEKEQVAMLAAEALALLDRIEADFPDAASVPVDVVDRAAAIVQEQEPLFRAQVIGLGFDPQEHRVMIELRERPQEEELGELGTEEIDEEEGRIARIFATPSQVRAMATIGAEAVGNGRPRCPLCTFPMDPSGHICPRWN